MTNQMMMGLLVIAAIILIIIIIVILVMLWSGGGRRDDDEDYEEDDDSYAEEEEENRPRPRKQKRQEENGGAKDQAPHPRKKQWKILLENLDTWEKFSFTIYDNIGIGRVENKREFERYLTVKDDPRVSKVHCQILVRDNKLYVKDMDSRNGTYLNGKRIEKPMQVQKDDIIGVGETKIEISKVLRERD